MKYYAVVDGESHEIGLQEDGVRLAGTVIDAELIDLPGGRQHHLRLGDRGYWLTAARADGRWLIGFSRGRLTVEVEDERTRLVRELTSRGAVRPRLNDLRAPMPGLILRVLVEPGDAVHAGDGLVVIEAMKMENEIKAQAAGIVERVAVSAGETVTRGVLLVAFRQEEGEAP